MNAYQSGITARIEGKGKHMNPFIGETRLFQCVVRLHKTEWDCGWEAEDSAQKAKIRTVVTTA